VNNTYLRRGNDLYRQKIGIPMGTNCAPLLANLYLYYYESTYISKLLREKKWRDAQLFWTSFRLMDDVFSYDNPFLLNAITKPYEEGGIYPQALTLKQTSEANGKEAEFIGMHLSLQNLEKDEFITSKVLFKERKFPWPVLKYPLVKSLIPRAVPYAVFTGELHRAHIICRPGNNERDDFVEAAVKIGVKLVKNGCAPTQLRAKFAAFVHKHVARQALFDGRIKVTNHRNATTCRFRDNLHKALQAEKAPTRSPRP